MFNQTKAKTPSEYFKLVPKEYLAELKQIDALIKKNAPSLKPCIISGMLGYGPYKYKSQSGSEGDWFVIGLARQKNYFSLYICALTKEGKYLAEGYKKELPKASIGKSCIRFTKLSDVDEKVLIKIIKEAVKLGGMNTVK
ncbi:DUF1801 domain-containing protein [Candidatus Micrarchaeota archaeon]|nr:DUF1801 domain-containing protein [Candidatus Micrarchaeota archaeon]